MDWNPLRRWRRDTIPVTVDMVEDEHTTCADCSKTFRNSPGNWHQESPTEGICNTCHHTIKDRLRRPYTRTRIGF